MLSNFLDDGYTEKSFIRGVPGLFGDLRFEFRPMRLDQRAPVLSKWNKLEADKQTAAMAQFVARQLVSWQLKTAKGHDVPVSAENLMRLRPALQERLVNIVLGIEPADLDGDATLADQSAQAERELQAILEGVTVGESKAVADAKN